MRGQRKRTDVHQANGCGGAVLQGVQEPIGLMGFQFTAIRPAGGHGQDAGADRTGAPNVVWRVTHDENFIARQRALAQFEAAIAGDDSDLVAIFVVVAKRARFK